MSRGFRWGDRHPTRMQKGGSGSGKGKAGGGGAQPSQNQQQDLSAAEMQERVPQQGGNSRIYAARSLIEDGGLSNQQRLREFDMPTYIDQLAGLNSAAIRQMTRDDGTIQTFFGTTTGTTTPTAYRQYLAQANRDARRIWNASSQETRDFWASQGQVRNPRNSRNANTRRISRDLSRRYNQQQEAAAAARRAEKAARRSQRNSSDDGLGGLFG